MDAKRIGVSRRSLRQIDDYSMGITLPKKVIEEQIDDHSSITVVLESFEVDNGDVVFKCRLEEDCEGVEEMCLDEFGVL